MAAIVIHSKSTENLQLLAALATKLGEKVNLLEEDMLEDFVFGAMMKNAKTGKTVSKETIMNKLRDR